MKHFGELLEIIGGKNNQLIETSSFWDFWGVTYITPVGPTQWNYLYLKSKCPLKEATDQHLKQWKKISSNGQYDIIVTPKSSLAKNLDQTKKKFDGREIATSKQIVLDNIFKELTIHPTEVEPYFIDPDIERVVDNSLKDATNYLASWFVSAQSAAMNNNSLGFLRAHAGIGKTTLARILSNQIHARDKSTIPILVESDQWRFLLQSDIKLTNIWDAAITKRFHKNLPFLSNEDTMRVLIREGIFPIIFDGFDELCLNPLCSYTPSDLIQDFIEMLQVEDGPGNAKILLTTRETFWQNMVDDLDENHLNQIDLFKLRGFSKKKRKLYFIKRLKDPSERDTAMRIAKQISGKLYEDFEIEATSFDRPEGVPFILDMISSFVKDNPDPNINPYKADPLAPLLEGVCRRENIRQNLNIQHENQLELFEEMFRDHNEEMTIDDIKMYLEIFCDDYDESIVNRFANHFFLKKKQDGYFCARYEVLKVYFIARFLANGLIDITSNVDKKKIAEILAASSTGNTQIVDWLVNQLIRLDKKVLVKAIQHALEIINDPENITKRKKAGMAIFNVINRLIKENDKIKRSKQLSIYLKADTTNKVISYKNNFITGNIKSIDFSNSHFIDCTIIDVDFKNCIFSTATLFNKCEFEKTLKFTNCKGESSIKSENCYYSKDAEYCMDKIKKRPSKPSIKKAYAEDALMRALKKFKSQFGYGWVPYQHRLKGFNPTNPCNEIVWNLLIKNNIIEKDKSTEHLDPTLKLVKDHDIRKEIMTFIDNGYLGTALKKVVTDMTNKI